MHPCMDVLALTPLGPIGLDQAEPFSPSTGPLDLAPLSPVPTASIDHSDTTSPRPQGRPTP